MCPCMCFKALSLSFGEELPLLLPHLTNVLSVALLLVLRFLYALLQIWHLPKPRRQIRIALQRALHMGQCTKH